jgi:hypothetical protein
LNDGNQVLNRDLVEVVLVAFPEKTELVLIASVLLGPKRGSFWRRGCVNW